jgi:hypothetical protein
VRSVLLAASIFAILSMEELETEFDLLHWLPPA